MALRCATRALGRALSTAAAAPRPEAAMAALLRERLAATHVDVKDVSGGCGSFYNVTVVSPRFEGMPMIRQHRRVPRRCARRASRE